MVLLDGDSLALGELLAIADNYTPVGLSPQAVTRVDAARAVVDDRADRAGGSGLAHGCLLGPE